MKRRGGFPEVLGSSVAIPQTYSVVSAVDTYLGLLNLRVKGQQLRMSESTGRPMKYPYTFSAKMAQFPLRFHLENQWLWRYWFIAIAVATPVFYKIHKLANSPENVSKWAEIRKKEAAKHH